MDTEEHLLADVLGEVVVTDEMDDVSPDWSLHLSDETLERGAVTRGCRHDDGGIRSIHVAAPRASDRIFIQRRVRILLLLVDVSDVEPSLI